MKSDLFEIASTIARAGAAPHIEAGLRKRIARLEADLHECLEFLEGQVDVVDGDYGEPAPNKAMKLTTMIKETLGQ